MVIKKKKGEFNVHVVELTEGKLMAISHGLRKLGEGSNTHLTTLQVEVLESIENYLKTITK
jgi:hypothetical protein